MIKVGVRVVRGPNWSWANEDGGEGHVGILRKINDTNKTAVVQWDNGYQMQCRVGCLDKYDIRIIDNAQIGIKHKKHICDGCNSGDGICGIRYKCTDCNDYDLCYACYHADKHDLNHSFRRIETSTSEGINLPPRLGSRKCELIGIFKGAEVIRGVDWEWSNQDGGQGKLGIVLDIKGWKNKSKRSTVYVQWLHGNSELYRLGHKGYCDIQFVTPSSGGHYYPEHLPVLGQTEKQMEWNQILDIIEVQQVIEFQNKDISANVIKVDDKNIREKQEIHSPTVQLNLAESIFASEIIKYNNLISGGGPKINLVNEFSSMVSQFGNNEVNDLWKMVKYMAQLPEVSQYGDVVKTRYTPKFIEILIQNGKKYLEDSYKAYMMTEVNNDICQLRHGDVSEIYPLVHNFVGLRFQGEYLGLQDGMVDHRPLWPMVYYCIRLGDLSTAISCLELCPLASQDIISILKAKLNSPNDPAIPILEEKVKFSYKTVVRNETDPFKRVVWSLMGGCNELSEVIKTVDDYLWFNLNLIHTDVFNQYAHLQNMILEEQGESHYDAFNKPLVYFKLLMLTGQFEAAIDFLFRTENFKIDAVHMAVALNEINWLVLPQDITVPLLSIDSADVRAARYLNLALLVKHYVGKFEECFLHRALHYFFLLRNCTDTNGNNLFEVFISDLAINSKEYEKIYGKLQKNGAKTMGLLDQFNVDFTIETVVQTLMKNDLYEEVIDLYDAINNQEGVLSVMCLVLSKVAHLENQPGSLRNRLQERAIFIERRLSRDADKTTSPNLINSFMKLQGLLKFFDLYRAKQYPDALKELVNLEILSLRFEELNRKVKNIKNFNGDLHRLIPDVLLATMTILLAQYDNIKKTENIDEFVANKHIQCMWEQANCVINFAERLSHEITGHVIDRLIQMEILMH